MKGVGCVLRTEIPLKDTTEKIQSAHFLASFVSTMLLSGLSHFVHWKTLKITKQEINFVRRNFPKLLLTE